MERGARCQAAAYHEIAYNIRFECRRRYRAFQKLWDAGHVGPRGSIISGSYFNLTRHGSHVLFEKWFKEYNSDNVGFYYGSQPFIVSRDLDLAKQIIIKDFQKFRNRTVSSWRDFETSNENAGNS